MFKKSSDRQNEDCCTHYRESGYDFGYIMLPIFKVRVCRNCGDVKAIWGAVADVLFMLFFRWFWNGNVHMTGDKLEEE